MDTRLNALIAGAQRQEIALRSTRPRFDATASPALAASRARSRRRRAGRRPVRAAIERGRWGA